MPIISSREEKRPYSGFVDVDGNLLVSKVPRAILNRNLRDYVCPTTIKH